MTAAGVSGSTNSRNSIIVVAFTGKLWQYKIVGKRTSIAFVFFFFFSFFHFFRVKTHKLYVGNERCDIGVVAKNRTIARQRRRVTQKKRASAAKRWRHTVFVAYLLLNLFFFLSPVQFQDTQDYVIKKIQKKKTQNKTTTTATTTKSAKWEEEIWV